MRIPALFLSLLLTSTICFSGDQDTISEKLKTLSGNEKAKYLNELSYHAKDPIKAVEFGMEALKLSKKINNQDEESQALSNIAYGYYFQSNYQQARAYFVKFLEIRKKAGNKEEIVKALNNLGVINQVMSNFEEAISYYQESLDLKREIGDELGVGKTLSNIAVLYYSLNDYLKAIEINEKALKIYEKLNDKKGLASSYNNLGINYVALEDYEKALEYYQTSLQIKKEIQDKKGIGSTLNNIGVIYKDLKEYEKCREYLEKALNIRTEISDKYGMASTYDNLGELFMEQSEFEKALEYVELSLNLAERLHLLDIRKRAYKNLADIYTHMNNYERALQNFRKYSMIKDSILNAESLKRITDLQTRFELSEEQISRELKQKDDEIIGYKLKQRNNMIRALVLLVFLLVVTILSIIIYKLYHRNLRYSKELSKTNEALEDKVRNRTHELEFEIQERKKIEESLREAKTRAENATKSKTMFLASMSHEIRTPMSSLLGILEVLDSTELTEEQKELLDILNTSGNNLLNIINEVLDLSKIEAGQTALMMSTFKPKCVIEETLDLFRINVESKGLMLVKNISDTFPEEVIGDPERFKQIISNLIGNALKFTSKGEINLNARLIDEDKQRYKVQIDITDTGVGIPEEKQNMLFKAFSQIQNSNHKAEKGSGLGLLISKHLVDLMKGEIGVKSEPGKGSTFWFTAQFEKKQ